MGFWKNLWAVLRSPDIVAELESERAVRRQLYATLTGTQNELEKTDTDAFLLERKLERTTAKLDACQAAVRALCSCPPSNEELKQIYEAAAPLQDQHGFSLYFAAKTLTGIDISTYFPYEENKGLFEAAKGPLLLRYLTAAQFGAVTWEVVPGTSYERAVLGQVDTAAPEYQKFEWEIYGKALGWLEFQDIFAPNQELNEREDKSTELKLYSRLYGELTGQEDDAPQPIDGKDLLPFQAAIRQGIEDEQLTEEAERGLMLQELKRKAVKAQKSLRLDAMLELKKQEHARISQLKIDLTIVLSRWRSLMGPCRAVYCLEGG